MAQNWVIVNLDRLEGAHVFGSDVQRLGLSLFGTYHIQLNDLLVRPWFSSRYPRPVVNVLPANFNPAADFFPGWHHQLQRNSPRTTLGRFSSLPTEIIYNIIFLIDDIIDAIILCLTHTTLFCIGYPIVQFRYLQDAPAWEGKRMICVGACARLAELPRGLFSRQELKRIKWWHQKEVEAGTYDDAVGFEHCQGLLYDYVQETFRSCRVGPPITPPDQIKYRLGPDYWHTMPEKNIQALAYSRLVLTSNEENDPWLLCNMSRGLYVNIDVVDQLLSDKGIGWQQILISNICWSSYYEVSKACGGEDIYHGKWAGDRFVVLSRSRLGEVPWVKVEDWKDITIQEVRRMLKLWRREFSGGEERLALLVHCATTVGVGEAPAFESDMDEEQMRKRVRLS